MKKYTTAFPFFPQHEIEWILNETREILTGKKMLSMGDNVREFEQRFADYCRRKYAIATNSCTSALNAVLKSLNLTDSDEIIVPTQTFFANLSSIVNAGATPIFCDTDENFLINYQDLQSKITNKTKAVVVVHFAGAISQDIFKIKALCKQHNIILIEDCAHAHGACAKDCDGLVYKAGSIGDIACFSFFSTKVMTTGEGGMILCDNEDIALYCRSFANRGLTPLSQTETFQIYGENFRFSEFNATLGLSQLRCLEDFIHHRNRIAHIYSQELKDETGLRLQTVASGFRHAYWRFIIFLFEKKPQEIIKQLSSYGIAADAPYSPLLHKHPIVKESFSCPISEQLSKTHISLPIHMKISPDDAKRIAKILKGILHGDCTNE